METIFAKSSGIGKAGVAVYRLSGPHALDIAFNLTKKSTLKEGNIQLAKLHCPKSDKFIDSALVLYFKKPHSFTGEDVIEFHTHGSIAVDKILTSVLLNNFPIRLAEAGEFSKRAFLNNKMDLTSAEGLADLLEAETEQQHKQAAEQMNGELADLYNEWRAKILKIMGLVEAYIDFPDEDIPENILDAIDVDIEELITAHRAHLDDKRRGERLRTGIKLAIFGPTNAGKSSLLNYLSQREVAIVSDIAGTTRDILENYIDINGFPIILADTAGLRVSQDVIEQQGIEKAKQAAKQADIKLLVIEYNENYEQQIEQFSEYIDENTIIIINKIDKISSSPEVNTKFNPIYISVAKKRNLDQLLENISKIAANLTISDQPALTRERHRKLISESLIYLENFSLNKDLVLAAEDLRMSAQAIGQITGHIDPDEVLGEIFANFCVGK